MIVCILLLLGPELPVALGVTSLLSQPAEYGAELSSAGLISGVARTSVVVKGLATVAVDKDGEILREARDATGDIVGDKEGAA